MSDVKNAVSLEQPQAIITERDSDVRWTLVLATAISVVVLWICSIFIVEYLYGSPSNAGEFGDMFGAINALFSGLAFAGVIVAVLLQRTELKLQREELEATRKELATSAAAHAKSALLTEKLLGVEEKRSRIRTEEMLRQIDPTFKRQVFTVNEKNGTFALALSIHGAPIGDFTIFDVTQAASFRRVETGPWHTGRRTFVFQVEDAAVFRNLTDFPLTICYRNKFGIDRTMILSISLGAPRNEVCDVEIVDTISGRHGDLARLIGTDDYPSAL